MNTVQHVALHDKQIMLHLVRFFGRMRKLFIARNDRSRVCLTPTIIKNPFRLLAGWSFFLTLPVDHGELDCSCIVAAGRGYR
jgi:hypothetical protein